MCSCIVAVCRAESCSVVFSYNVVQLPCCFFLPVFAELCNRRTGLSKVFLFFSTRLIFKVCNSEDIFTVNAFFFSSGGGNLLPFLSVHCVNVSLISFTPVLHQGCVCVCV